MASVVNGLLRTHPVVARCALKKASISKPLRPSFGLCGPPLQHQNQCREVRVSFTRGEEHNSYGNELGLDFYEILGVSTTAETPVIKKAYYDLIRQIHPDVADDEESTQLCVLLNEIYDTLTDLDKRAVYDTIAGFSESSINPFYDESYAKDQVFVDEINCIGCGKCASVCPKSFEIEKSKYGRARVVKQGLYSEDEIDIAIQCCPVTCISYVSTPQLSLLETALASIQRIDVFIMMRYGTTGEDVFEVANKAWERRNQRYQKAASKMSFFGWTMGGATDAAGGEGDQAGARGDILDPSSRRIAKLAAAAARAMRLWRNRASDREPIAQLAEPSMIKL